MTPGMRLSTSDGVEAAGRGVVPDGDAVAVDHHRVARARPVRRLGADQVVARRGGPRVRVQRQPERRVVSFSCKGRGFCPSCLGRRMASTAANLVEHVLPSATAAAVGAHGAVPVEEASGLRRRAPRRADAHLREHRARVLQGAGEEGGAARTGTERRRRRRAEDLLGPQDQPAPARDLPRRRLPRAGRDSVFHGAAAALDARGRRGARARRRAHRRAPAPRRPARIPRR